MSQGVNNPSPAQFFRQRADDDRGQEAPCAPVALEEEKDQLKWDHHEQDRQQVVCFQPGLEQDKREGNQRPRQQVQQQGLRDGVLFSRVFSWDRLRFGNTGSGDYDMSPICWIIVSTLEEKPGKRIRRSRSWGGILWIKFFLILK